MIRDLAERGVLQGTSCSYVCHTDVAEVSVPAPCRPAIAARIDCLGTGAKKTINAAAVIGSRFAAALLTVLGVDPILDEVMKAELIDQVRFTPRAEYGFRHPLIARWPTNHNSNPTAPYCTGGWPPPSKAVIRLRLMRMPP